MKTGVIKFNNGNGALLCPDCRTIIMYGIPHATFYYCDKCKQSVENPLTNP